MHNGINVSKEQWMYWKNFNSCMGGELSNHALIWF